MTRPIMRVMLACAAGLCCTGAFGLLVMQEHPPGTTMPWSPDWPQGLRELVDWHGRVRGYSAFGIVDREEAYFAGDADAFSQFLARYADLVGTPLALVLHPGRGVTTPITDEEQKIPFDWMIGVNRVRQRDGGETDEARPRYVVTVELWLGGEVALEDLSVPVEVTVRSGGEIEAFIEAHEAGRDGDETG